MKSINKLGLEETHLMSDVLGYMDLRIKNKDKIAYKVPKMFWVIFDIKFNTFCNFECKVYFELYEENGNNFVNYFLGNEKLIDNNR